LNPKVSIIIPNYNHAAFLQQRLDSVFNQTFQDFEVILLDDASIDGSVKLLKSYKTHPKLSHLVLNSVNSGSPFKQWKKGIELAKGDYIWIAESDDYCKLNFLDTLLSLFTKNVVLCYCASNITDQNNNTLGSHKWADELHSNRWKMSYKNTGKEEIENFMRYRNTITNASAVIFKRETVVNLEFPNHMKFCGDWYIWIEILKQGDLMYSHLPLNYFRRHEGSTKPVKSLQLEQKRVDEYMEIIIKNSNRFSRFFNRTKYYWIFNEWREKFKSQSNSNIKNLTLDFLIYNKLKCGK
jgi:glycosyltransferase involved in cell wall biosynthesis